MKFFNLKKHLVRKIIVSMLLNVNAISVHAYTDNIIYEMKVQLTQMIASLIELHATADEDEFDGNKACVQVENFQKRSEIVLSESVYIRHLPYNLDIDESVRKNLITLSELCASDLVNREVVQRLSSIARETGNRLGQTTLRFLENQAIFEKEATREIYKSSQKTLQYARTYTGLDKLKLDFIQYGCDYNVALSYFTDGLSVELNNNSKREIIGKISHDEAKVVFDEIKATHCH
ncbi:hypothetical protein M899_1777 [Bacteriovorax sp. BSW11_IV]|uniref:hypothetical protein n=1 Tax=Bacteriovorax sp. BSW11_IV TaxID=1353529 RepID=UPI00038A31DC|nr:hypothetical protein [Bacteriovorax sp. BSW11_IV]EQC49410.1 hypothetical protein M899_1777 [Bacteriovorax sp. BSW11_IV]